MQQDDALHPEDKRNLIIFAVVAGLLYIAFNHFVVQPRLDRATEARAAALKQVEASVALTSNKPEPRDQAVAGSPRLTLNNGQIFGSIALRGGRLDDISLQHYSATLGKDDHVVLLSPAGTAHPEYEEAGWVSDDAGLKLPGVDTVWQADATTLGPEGQVHLSWDNGAGLRFTRTLSLDGDYMLTETDGVTNAGNKPVTLSHYALVSQHGLPEDATERSGRVFEGGQGDFDGKSVENSYPALAKKPVQATGATHGWIGLSQKYWFTGLIPDQQTAQTFRFVFTPSPDPLTRNADVDKMRRPDKFQVDVTAAPQTVAPGASAQDAVRIYAGAKEAKTLQRYAAQIPGSKLDLVIDWGLYWFLTRPFFLILDYFGHLFGNFGFAIIALTIVVRVAVFPLANASFRSFAKMKKISPQMTEMRKNFAGDKQKMQAALVELYEKEKVNPMAGCLPLVLQIPIFFALYKVLAVTIELRHAPFIGWVHDLSAQDPTTVFNLFGLLPFTPPAFLPTFGAWSCFMLLAMLAQRQLTPPSQDKSQQVMMNVQPFIITYVMSKFPAGLVIYWTFSNTLSVAQQYIIMRSNGADVHLFGRSKQDKDMEKLVASQPEVNPALGVIVDEADKVTKAVTPPKPKRKTKK